MSGDGRSGVFGGSLAGELWFGGWLFTLAFARLLWWQAILGLIVWLYSLGVLAR
ncbi:hypothetical protein JW848_10865 [Candidatus Bipolaricaulota bacterium]|nr:hypothetical protein [Candidatus Bipolaricaulota bacterium]